MEAAVAPGTWYWKLVEGRFESDGEILPPPGGGDESNGTHAIYMKALDGSSQPIENQEATVSWPTGNPTSSVSVRTKGSFDGYWGNFPMAGGWCPYYPDGGRGPYGAWVMGAASDAVWGMGMPCNRHVSEVKRWKAFHSGEAFGSGTSPPARSAFGRLSGLPVQFQSLEEGAERSFMGPPRGPWVLPGTYTVKVAFGGKEASGTVVVEDDPRITASDADRKAWHDALLETAGRGRRPTRPTRRRSRSRSSSRS